MVAEVDRRVGLLLLEQRAGRDGDDRDGHRGADADDDRAASGASSERFCSLRICSTTARRSWSCRAWPRLIGSPWSGCGLEDARGRGVAGRVYGVPVRNRSTVSAVVDLRRSSPARRRPPSRGPRHRPSARGSRPAAVRRARPPSSRCTRTAAARRRSPSRPARARRPVPARRSRARSSRVRGQGARARPRGRRARTCRGPRSRTRAAAPGPSLAGRAAPGRRGRGRRRPGGRRACALTSSAAAGELVGDGGRGHGQLVAVARRCGRRSPRATRSPAAPMAMSVWPVAPGPAGGVGDDARRRCGRSARGAGSRSRARRGVGVRGEQHAPCRRRRWRRRCRRRPWSGRGGCARSRCGPRRATTRTVSAASASSRLPGADPALGLADDLAGDDDDVAVARASTERPASSAARSSPGARPRRCPSTGAGPSSRRHAAVTGDQLARPRRPSRRWRRGRSSSGDGAAARCPAAATRSTWSASTLVDQPAVEHAAVGRGRRSARPTRGGADLDADRGEQLLGHAAHVGAADDGGEADDRRARSRAAPRGRRGTPRMVPTETTGLDGGSTHEVGVGDGLDDAGRRGGLVEPDRRPPPRPGTSARSRTQYSWKCTTRRPLAARRRRRSRRGSRPGRRSSAAGARPGSPAPAQRLGDRARAGSRRRASGCGPGGWRCRGRRGRTRSAPRRTPPAPPWRSRSRRGGPSRARRRCRRRGCTSRCRGRGRP